MSPAAFFDVNIPICAGGREYPHKAPCLQVLRVAALHPRSFFADIEVLQEPLHRYGSSGRWPLGRDISQSFAEAMRHRAEPVYGEDVEAGDLADRYPEVFSRDLLHAAVVKRLGSDCIMSTDMDFDRLPGLERLDPANFT